MQGLDAIVIGAGAAGMMAALTAARQGRRVVIIDHARVPGEKIRISGGGRCNFTNIHASPKNYLSANPHFAKSALARYTPADFIAFVESHGIAWHEKTLGQLFCDGSAKEIVSMFLKEMDTAGVRLLLQRNVETVEKNSEVFKLVTDQEMLTARSLIVASGGKSIPKMGATGLAYKIAAQFGVNVLETRPGLVPLTFDPGFLEKIAPLAGIAVDVSVSHGKTAFREAMLFTHRGLSGPAILQISSYWREGDDIAIHIAPDVDFAGLLTAARRENGRQSVSTALSSALPKRLAQFFVGEAGADGVLAEFSGKAQARLVEVLRQWRVRPAGSEGYRTAEVTLGGVDTADLDSRTLQARHVPGLYFIGECVDVTGWLGGYNFQWAWASGHAAGVSI